MKVIDEKGRIFGVINLIDFLVIAFVILLIPMFYLSQKIFTTKQVIVKQHTVETEVKFVNIMPELASVIREGDVEMDSSVAVIGVLKKILVNKPSEILVLSPSNGKEVNFLVKVDPNSYQIRGLFELKCTKYNRVMYYNGNAVKIGSSIVFSTDLYSIAGVITSIKIKGKY